MDNNKTKSSLALAFSLAAAWMGTHCGSGFATGAQEAQFWAAHGAWGIFLPIVSALIMAIVAYCEWRFCVTFHTYDYNEFSKALFHPYEKIFGLIYRILFLGIMVMGVSAVFAGAGALLSEMFGMPYVVGVLIIMGITVVLTMFGSDFLRNSASVLSTILIVIIIIISTMVLSRYGGNLGTLTSNWETDSNIFKALWSGILYASFQCVILGSTINMSHGLTDIKQASLASILGFILNGAMMFLVTLMLLTHYPAVTQETLPVLSILQGMNAPFLEKLYSFMLLLAFITTAIGCIGAILSRVEKYGERQIPNITLRRFIYAAILIIACYFIAQVGLLTIIKKGYSAIGYLGIPFVILPILVVAPMKVRKALSEKKEQ